MDDPRRERGDDDERSAAVVHAEAGAMAWRAVVHAQQSATPEHDEFYELAGFMVETLRAVEALAGVLSGQVQGYAGAQPADRRVYDDTRTVDPRWRLDVAVSYLAALAMHGGDAGRVANLFWSVIGHIGVEDTGPEPPVAGSGGVVEGGVTR